MTATDLTSDRATIETEILQLHENLGHELARPPVSPRAQLRRERYVRVTAREIWRLQRMLARIDSVPSDSSH